MKEYAVAKEMHSQDIRNVRELLGMTQKEFASFLGCSKRTVESWEERDTPVTGPVVTLLDLLWRRPATALRMEIPERAARRRMWYMYRNMVCTLIDVDDRMRMIRVVNYVDNPQYCAFGIKVNPEYEPQSLIR